MERGKEKIKVNKDNELDGKIEIFSTEDENLKFLGELLSNKSSRTILNLLTKQEMSAAQISEKTDMSLSLVIHHLNKMLNAGIVTINQVKKNSKNHDVNYYLAKPALIILTKEVTERAKKSKPFSNSLKKLLRSTSIGIASVSSWFLSNVIQTTAKPPSAIEVPSGLKDIPEYMLWSTIVMLVVALGGLVIERLIIRSKRHS